MRYTASTKLQAKHVLAVPQISYKMQAHTDTLVTMHVSMTTASGI